MRNYIIKNLSKLSDRIKIFRWRTIGKIFQPQENRSLSLSFKFALINVKSLPARRGRPLINIFDQILRDIKEAEYTLETMKDFYFIQDMAWNEKEWMKFKKNRTFYYYKPIDDTGEH